MGKAKDTCAFKKYNTIYHLQKPDHENWWFGTLL